MEADLFRLPVVILDCQTTGAAPGNGFLLEIAWSVLSSVNHCSEEECIIHSFLVTLPDDAEIPRRIAGMTGISAIRPGEGLERSELAKILLAVLRRGVPVAHFASFEQRWIEDLLLNSFPDEDIPRFICTREIARRLYPRLPRKGIRAVAGYLGHSMDEKKRASSHVHASVYIWRRITSELRDKGIKTLKQLEEFLAEPVVKSGASWKYPLLRETRLSLPDAPGVYRLLSKNGKVLYAGKASSLKKRVNTYFTRRKADEKTLELVSQVHDIHTSVCETPLEAALLEFQTIREFDPPYNVALRKRESRTIFLSKDLSCNSASPADGVSRGPVLESSPAILLREILTSINEGGTVPPQRLGLDYHPLAEGALESGFTSFREELFPEMDMPASPDSFLSAGLAVWLQRIAERENDKTSEEEKEKDPVEFIDAAGVKKHLEWLLAAGARDIRRGAWFRLLGWSCLLWKPASSERSRSIQFSAGRIVSSFWITDGDKVPSDPAHVIGRGAWSDPELFHLLRVLDSEVRRITADGNAERIRVPRGQYLSNSKLQALYGFI